MESEAAAVDALKRIGELDRRRVREAFERRFTAAMMTEKYAELYRRLAS